MKPAFTLVALLFAGAAHAAVWTCKEDDRIVFRSTICAEGAETIRIVEGPKVTVVRAAPRAVPERDERWGKVGGSCRETRDCMGKLRCSKQDGKEFGSCF